MKRIVCLLLVVALALSVPAMLGVTKIDTLVDPGESSAGAYATFIDNNPDAIATKPNSDGTFVVEKDGEKVVVVPVGDHKNQQLVVRFFNPSDKEAIKWMDETTGGLSDGFMPFEAFYLNKKGERTELQKGDKITINLAATDILIKCVAPDGSVVDVPFTVDGNNVTFEAPGGKFCYYAVVTKSADTGTNPDTGILFDEVSWFAILTLCASALGILLLIRKRSLDLEMM